MTEPVLHVVGLDHVVLDVADVERSLAFYCGELGLEPVRVERVAPGRGPVPVGARRRPDHPRSARRPRTGVNADHLCLVVEPVDLDAIRASGRFEVVDGPAIRFGARGNGTSLYVRDPDGNTVELRHYGV